MESVIIRCPHCGFERQIPLDRVPPGTRTVTCPKCSGTFAFDKERSSGSEIASTSPPPPPTPPEGPLRAASPPPPPVFPPRPAIRPHWTVASPRTRKSLSTLGELLDRTWSVYKRRAVTLVLLNLMILLLAAGPIVIAALGAKLLSDLGIVVFVFAGVTLATLGGSWGLAALTCGVVDDSLDVKEALERGWSLTLSFLWIMSLAAFMVCGGYLLLGIPGIVFSVWFVFSQYGAVIKETRGMESLLESREAVQGFFWPVAGRLLLVILLGTAAGLIPFLGPILSFLFTPFMMLWIADIYRNLHEIKGEHPFSAATSEKFKWFMAGAAGYLFVIFFVIAMYGSAALEVMDKVRALGLPPLPGVGKVVAPAPAPPPATPRTGSGPVRPGEFSSLSGTWSGPETRSRDIWTFTFTPDTYGLTASSPAGEEFAGSGAIHFELGAEANGSMRVPPGWGILDVDVASGRDPAAGGKIALGAFSVTGNNLKLCVGQPGQTVRPRDFPPSHPDIRCFELTRNQQAPASPAGPVPAAVTKVEVTRPGSRADRPDDVYVYIYSANYSGSIRINNRDFHILGEQKDMQYNQNKLGRDYFNWGKNTVEINYSPLPGLPQDHWLMKLEVKISKGDTVLGEWIIKDRSSGQKYIDLDIPR